MKQEEGHEGSPALKVVGWASVALGVTALGLFVGRELRVRYKLRRRTPYEMYAHAGDRMASADYGMGI